MDKKLLCGVDLGGTKLSAGLFGMDGSLIGKEVVYDHNDKRPDEIIKITADLITVLLKKNNVDARYLSGIGVGLAGHILYRKGIVITTSNFSEVIRDYPFVNKLSAYFPDVKIVLDNDANAQAFGEYKYGAGKGYDSMVFMTISTGIGAGIVINGKLLRGRSGTAGEIGHSIIDVNSRIRCTCGNYGCLMSLSSGLFLPQLYLQKLDSGMQSKINITKANINDFNGQLFKKGILEKDPVSLILFKETSDRIGAGVFNIFQFLNPDVVILGGGMMKLGNEYLNRIKTKFRSLTHEMMVEEMEIKLTKIGEDAGLLGAASLLLEVE
ncbi:MAG: ROK family protein [Spirochaetes bacterium]|nr:ROK family protein [Spirochaetota bacterium]